MTKPRLLSSVAVDTMTLIYSHEGSSKYPDRARNSKAFLDQCARDNRQICLPSIVVAEFVVKQREPGNMIMELANHFQILEFDIGAAKIAAEIRAEQLRRAGNQGRCDSCNRSYLKSDIMIIATCIQNRVDELITCDGLSGLSSLDSVSRRIRISPPPEPETTLFDGVPSLEAGPGLEKRSAD